MKITNNRKKNEEISKIKCSDGREAYNAGSMTGPKKSIFKFNRLDFPMPGTNLQIRIAPEESVDVNPKNTIETAFYNSVNNQLNVEDVKPEPTPGPTYDYNLLFDAHFDKGEITNERFLEVNGKSLDNLQDDETFILTFGDEFYSVLSASSPDIPRNLEGKVGMYVSGDQESHQAFICDPPIIMLDNHKEEFIFVVYKDGEEFKFYFDSDPIYDLYLDCNISEMKASNITLTESTNRSLNIVGCLDYKFLLKISDNTYDELVASLGGGEYEVTGVTKNYSGKIGLYESEYYTFMTNPIDIYADAGGSEPLHDILRIFMKYTPGEQGQIGTYDVELVTGDSEGN